jgi:hypothetical protein
MKTTISFILILFLISCKQQSVVDTKETNTSTNSSIASKSSAKPNIYNCQLIEKEFINKGGKAQGFSELYLRCSVQDYFIKLCASNVTKEQLMPYLDQGISVEVEIQDGMWDHCDDNMAHVQSRMGPYVIIKSIK